MFTRSNVNNNTQKTGPSRGLRLFVWCVDLFLLVLVGVAIYVVIVFLQMPSLDAILHETRPAAIVFLDKNGNEIRSSNRIMGTPVSVETLPPYVWQAIVAIEDKRFFEHGPIDIRGITRAMLSNLVHGRLAAGGSSITQQTAKNIFLSREKKDFAQGSGIDSVILVGKSFYQESNSGFIYEPRVIGWWYAWN